MVDTPSPKTNTTGSNTPTNGLTNAVKELIPFRTSSRLWKEGRELAKNGQKGKAFLKKGEAALWGAVDAAGIASLAIPVVGEFVEGGVACAKVARSVSVVKKVADTTKVMEKLPKAAKAVKAVGKAYPAAKKALPHLERVARLKALKKRGEGKPHSTGNYENLRKQTVVVDSSTPPKAPTTKRPVSKNLSPAA